MAGKLYWESSYEIVLQLIETYPRIDLDQLGINQLLEFIIALPDFSDDVALASDDILTEILREWYEEVNA